MPTDWCTIGQARVEVVKGDVDVGDVDLVVGARLDEAELKGRGGARLYVDLPKLPFDAAPSAAGGARGAESEGAPPTRGRRGARGEGSHLSLSLWMYVSG